MSASLHLASAEDVDRLLPMVRAFHAASDLALDESARRAAVAPLLDGSPHGAIWLIGPRKSPVGYIVITFGWSLAAGGLIGTIDEFFIRENVRGRGMGSEVLLALSKELAASGLMALHANVPPGNERAQQLAERLGFRPREGYRPMIAGLGGGH